ncbi:MAG: hypothetical protein ABL921_26900 [Pirellula sp.]
MHNEMRVRFNRVINAIRAVIDSLTAQDAAWEELKKGTVGVYADSAMACSNARQAFEDETPTMDALVIALRDNCYKDPTWQTDGEDDVKLLRMVWHAIHKTIEAGKSFAPDDIGVMRNLCAALERARDSSIPIEQLPRTELQLALSGKPKLFALFERLNYLSWQTIYENDERNLQRLSQILLDHRIEIERPRGERKARLKKLPS